MIWAPGFNAGTLGLLTWLSTPSLPARQRVAVARVQLVACPPWPGTAERCLPQTGQGQQGGARGRGASPAGQREGFLEEGVAAAPGASLAAERGGQYVCPSPGWGGWEEGGSRLTGFLGCSPFIQMERRVKHLEVVRPRPFSGGRSRGEAAPGASAADRAVWPRLAGQQAASRSVWEAEGTGLGSRPWGARGVGLGGWVGSGAARMGVRVFSCLFLCGGEGAEINFSCAVSVWLWCHSDAGLKDELGAVPPVPFSRVDL